MIGLISAWCGHTPDSKELAEDIRTAILAVCGSEKAAAVAMGLTPEELSRQLAGRVPLNVYRLTFLPASFASSFLRLRAQRIGGSFLSEQEKNFILGFIGVGRKKLARFLVSEQKEQQAS